MRERSMTRTVAHSTTARMYVSERDSRATLCAHERERESEDDNRASSLYTASPPVKDVSERDSSELCER